MQENNLTALDFDAALELASKDPEAFEQFRLDAIKALIATAPERTRLHLQRLQWRLEQFKKRSPNRFAAGTKTCTARNNKQPRLKAKILAFPVSRQ